ncbi:MAG: rhodanese-like domain-containing protein [Bacteroidota bacterium]
MTKHSTLFLGLALVVAGGVTLRFFSGCAYSLDAVEAAARSAHPEAPVISTSQLASWLADSSRTPLLLDAREADEYAVSHLPGAVRVDPDASADDLTNQLGGLAEAGEVVVYCSVGYRSGGVVERLREAGYENVFNLEGSIFRWANEGRPLVRDGEPVGLVHPYNRTWGRLLHKDLRAPLDG